MHHPPAADAGAAGTVGLTFQNFAEYLGQSARISLATSLSRHLQVFVDQALELRDVLLLFEAGRSDKLRIVAIR